MNKNIYHAMGMNTLMSLFVGLILYWQLTGWATWYGAFSGWLAFLLLMPLIFILNGEALHE